MNKSQQLAKLAKADAKTASPIDMAYRDYQRILNIETDAFEAQRQIMEVRPPT
jgi:hypothetical protein